MTHRAAHEAYGHANISSSMKSTPPKPIAEDFYHIAPDGTVAVCLEVVRAHAPLIRGGYASTPRNFSPFLVMRSPFFTRDAAGKWCTVAFALWISGKCKGWAPPPQLAGAIVVLGHIDDDRQACLDREIPATPDELRRGMELVTHIAAGGEHPDVMVFARGTQRHAVWWNARPNLDPPRPKTRFIYRWNEALQHSEEVEIIAEDALQSAIP